MQYASRLKLDVSGIPPTRHCKSNCGIQRMFIGGIEPLLPIVILLTRVEHLSRNRRNRLARWRGIPGTIRCYFIDSEV